MDEELSHDGGERHLGGFALGAELLVVGFEERIVQGRAEGCQLVASPRGPPTAPDVPLPAQRAAVRVHRGDTRESGNGSTRQLA